MSVSNGQTADENTFNNAFVSRTVDTDTTGKVDLKNVAAASGANVTNLQREINSLNAFTGRPAGSAYNADPAWTTNAIGLSTNDLKERCEALTTALATLAAANTGTSSGTNTGDVTSLGYVSGGDANVVTFTGQAMTFHGATDSTAGVLTPVQQYIGGVKDFMNRVDLNDGLTLGTLSNSVSGSNAEIYGYPFQILTSGTLTSIAQVAYPTGLVASTNGYFMIVMNGTGNSITIKNDTGATTDKRILTGTGADMVLPNSQAVFLIWQQYSGKYHVVGMASAVTTVGAVGSSPNANGASVSAGTLTLQPADGTNPGVVTAGTQTIGGNKTFSGTIGASNLSGTNTGDVTVGAVGSSPNANGASLTGQALTLQPADGTNPGLITAGTQTIGGDKTLSGALTLSKYLSLTRSDDSTTTGSNASLAAFTAGFVKLTNASLVSINNVPAGANGQLLVLKNKTGAAITIVNDSGGTAANRIVTGTGANLSMSNDSTLLLAYDSGASRWTVVGGSGGATSPLTTKGDLYTYSTADARLGVGADNSVLVADASQTTGLKWGPNGPLQVISSFGSPTLVGTSGISSLGFLQRNLYRVASTGGDVTVTGSPAITGGSLDGQELVLIGTSDTDTVTFADGNGLSMNGSITLYKNSAITFVWDSGQSLWVETSRRQ